MLSQLYESTEVERKNWLHAPRGLFGPPANNIVYMYIHTNFKIFKSDNITSDSNDIMDAGTYIVNLPVLPSHWHVCKS